MSENATETDATAQGHQVAQETTTDETDWKAESRKWEQRAKENLKAKSDLEKQQRAAMTDAERAIAEAEARGRTAAATEYGARLARTQFDALAGRRNPDFDSAKALEYVDLTKFLDDQGEPNVKAITSAVERLVPEANGGATSYDGGARTTARASGDMNSVIRKAAGYAG